MNAVQGMVKAGVVGQLKNGGAFVVVAKGHAECVFDGGGVEEGDQFLAPFDDLVVGHRELSGGNGPRFFVEAAAPINRLCHSLKLEKNPDFFFNRQSGQFQSSLALGLENPL